MKNKNNENYLSLFVCCAFVHSTLTTNIMHEVDVEVEVEEEEDDDDVCLLVIILYCSVFVLFYVRAMMSKPQK